MQEGLQHQGRLDSVFAAKLTWLAFWASILVCVGLPIAWYAGFRPAERGVMVVLPLSLLFFVAVSATVYTANTHLYNGRMHARLVYPPILFAMLAVASHAVRWLSERRERLAE